MIISKLSALKREMGQNAVLSRVIPSLLQAEADAVSPGSPIEEDGQRNVDCYNDELSTHPDYEKRWFTMNWLFAECYLSVRPITSAKPLMRSRYRRIWNYFAMTEHWRGFDPFFTSKVETYKSSSGAIVRECTEGDMHMC